MYIFDISQFYSEITELFPFQYLFVEQNSLYSQQESQRTWESIFMIKGKKKKSEWDFKGPGNSLRSSLSFPCSWANMPPT